MCRELSDTINTLDSLADMIDRTSYHFALKYERFVFPEYGPLFDELGNYTWINNSYLFQFNVAAHRIQELNVMM